MGKQLFGTDGIRGIAGEYPLDAPTVYAFGLALANDVIRRHGTSPRVLIGADTRESGPWIAETVAAGLTSRGVTTDYAGVITTPGVAYLTRTGPYAAGVMISASHNPFEDNGLKVFGHSGFKLPDSEEHEIEAEILRLREAGGEIKRLELTTDATLAARYLDFLESTVSVRFEGVRMALDCGNGAAYRLAPELFRRLGAEVLEFNVQPDGRNINRNCGALHVEGLRDAAMAAGAQFGTAFDGDADRAIFVSVSGKVVDGDAVLLMAGRALRRAGKLRGDTVVATVMSNLGLERALQADGIRMTRTPVGDKYVLEQMVELDAVLGGEQSGHVIFRDFATTGDGILTALKVFEIAQLAGKGLDELTADLQVYPQKLVNIRVREKKGLLERPAVANEIRRVEEAFAGTGRVLVRFSGTEPLARVMVEGQDPAQVESFSASIADAIRREMGE